jgi:hypothetical protein
MNNYFNLTLKNVYLKNFFVLDTVMFSLPNQNSIVDISDVTFENVVFFNSLFLQETYAD